MFRVFVEVFVDHLKSAVENTVHDGWNLILHQILIQLLARCKYAMCEAIE